MKTNFKHIISLICALAIILSLCSPAFANEGLAFDMNALGITSGMNVETRMGEYVRRDEFAQMVVGMIMQQDVAKSLENEVYFNRR